MQRYEGIYAFQLGGIPIPIKLVNTSIFINHKANDMNINGTYQQFYKCSIWDLQERRKRVSQTV